jgi:hypothetical protein
MPASAFAPASGGYGSAYVIESFAGFERFVGIVMSNPSKHGHFHELLLSNRDCGRLRE